MSGASEGAKAAAARAPEPDAPADDAPAADAAGVSPQVEGELRDQVRPPPRGGRLEGGGEGEGGE